MQFKVPQDVQQADRIVWFLTLGQLIISAVGFAIAYGIFSVLQKQGLPFIIWLPPVAIVSLLTAAFAFLRIANLPFYKYLALIIERFITPSKRVWIKGADRVITDEDLITSEHKKQTENKEKADIILNEKEEKLKNIEELTRKVDIKPKAKNDTTNSETEKVDMSDDTELLRTAFLDKKPKAKKQVQTIKNTEEKILELSKKKPETTETKPNLTKESKNKKQETEKTQQSSPAIGLTYESKKDTSNEKSEQYKRPRKRKRKRKKNFNKNKEYQKSKEAPIAKEKDQNPVATQSKKKPQTNFTKKLENKVKTQTPEGKTSEPPIPDWLNHKAEEQENPKTAFEDNKTSKNREPTIGSDDAQTRREDSSVINPKLPSGHDDHQGTQRQTRTEPQTTKNQEQKPKNQKENKRTEQVSPEKEQTSSPISGEFQAEELKGEGQTINFNNEDINKES